MSLSLGHVEGLGRGTVARNFHLAAGVVLKQNGIP